MKKLLSILLCATIIATIFSSIVVPASALSASKTKKKLTSVKAWWCYECDGESGKYGPSFYYGHQQPQIFKIKFRKNNRFVCDLGAFISYSGTYKISKKGKVTLRIKKVHEDLKVLRPNKSVNLKISKKFKTISFKYKGIRNKFKRKWW